MKNENKMFFENLLTVKDLAEWLSVSPKTVYDWIHQKKIPVIHIGRSVRFRPSEIEKWLSKKGGRFGN